MAPPPAVADLIARWIPIAQRRTEGEGWSSPSEPESGPDAWSWLVTNFAEQPPSAGGKAQP
jgi:hypothetical protein